MNAAILPKILYKICLVNSPLARYVKIVLNGKKLIFVSVQDKLRFSKTDIIEGNMQSPLKIRIRIRK